MEGPAKEEDTGVSKEYVATFGVGEEGRGEEVEIAFAMVERQTRVNVI